jgi:hypothetical protein
MKVTSGREAIELLFNSDRTYQDILRMKLMLGDKFEMKLIARKWVDIDPELEFRSKSLAQHKDNKTLIAMFSICC